MRRLLLSDVVHLARALSQCEKTSRRVVLGQWIDQTRAAAKYRRRFGRPHQTWGDGSLTSRALLAIDRSDGAETRDQPDFLLALAQVSTVLASIGQLGRQ